MSWITNYLDACRVIAIGLSFSIGFALIGLGIYIMRRKAHCAVTALLKQRKENNK